MDEPDVIDIVDVTGSRGHRPRMEMQSLTVRELLTDLAASEATLRDGDAGETARAALTREQDRIVGELRRRRRAAKERSRP